MAVVVTGPYWGLTKFKDPLHIPPVIHPGSELGITMRAIKRKLHSQLPPATLWGYEGEVPGPTIDVRRDKQVRVAWTNDIKGPFPLTAVRGPNADSPTTKPGYPRDASGAPTSGYSVIEGVDQLPSWTVVHLHGARTNGGNDGWAHNAQLRGTSQLAEYQNRQPAMALWYHDHAAGITRFNVHTGLAGMWLLRDKEEEALNLPHGDREIPLLIQDRNFGINPATGKLAGQPLFKVQYLPSSDGSPENVDVAFTGPFNLVNGVVWPHLDVEPRWYRFRLLNGSNARFYTLNLIDEEGANHNDAARLIGSDGGLLPAPTALPAAGLTMAPAERWDLLVDFSKFRGRHLRLSDARVPDGTEPDVIEFRVENRSRPDTFRLPKKISKSYKRITHDSPELEGHNHVWVILLLNPAGHPEMWDAEELDADPGGEGIVQINDPSTGTVRTFRRIGKLFDETTGIFLHYEKWAVWNIVHVGALPPHPIHIHLTEFQILSRRSFTTTFDQPTQRTTAPLDGFADVTLEESEKGNKDTVIVHPGEWVSVAGHFGGGTGSFMYHCHIIDHEDEGMMRPFVVMPEQTAPFHPVPGGGHEH